MSGINLFIALALPTLAGYLLTLLLFKDEKELNSFERLFFGYGLGIGFMTIIIFFIGLLKIPFSVFSLSLIPVSFIIAGLFLILKLRIRFFNLTLPSLDIKNINRLKLFVISLIAIWITWKIAFVLYEGFNRPLFSWDAWSDWSGGAKFFFYEKGLSLDPSDEHFFGKGYRRFLGQPLLSPLLQVWISMRLGEFHEIYIKTWAPFYFISLLGIFFFAVRKETSSMPALIATLFLSGAPLLTFHATDGLSDLPMSYYVFAGVITFWRYLVSGDKRFLFLCSVFLGISIFTKNEGLVYAIITFLSLCIFHIDNKTWKSAKDALAETTIFAAPLILIAGPWLIFKAYFGLGYGHGDEFDVMKWERALHIEVFKIFFKEVFFSANHGPVFGFLAALTIFGFRTAVGTNIRYIYFIVLAIIPIFLFLYTTTIYHEAVTELTGLHRNILTFLPVVFFITTLLACRLLQPSETHSRE